MRRPPPLVPLLGLAAFLCAAAATEARAACTDAAAPAVQWRRCLLDGSDLSGADLARADLRDSSLKRADLSRSRLAGIQARRARFISANLAGADLTGVSFVGASLRGARLYDANLRGANLGQANLDGADLLRANLSGATWTDGATVCAEGSVGRCHPGGAGGGAPAAAGVKDEG